MKYIHLTFVAFFTTSFLSFSSFSYDDLLNYYKKPLEISPISTDINNIKTTQLFELFATKYKVGLTANLDITWLPSESRIKLLKRMIEYISTVSQINTLTNFTVNSYLYTINWENGDVMGFDKKPIRTNKDLSHLAKGLTKQFPLKNEHWENINTKLVQQRKNGMPIILEHEDGAAKIAGEKFLNGLNLFIDYKAAKASTPYTVLDRIKKFLKNEKSEKNIQLPPRNFGAQRFQSL